MLETSLHETTTCPVKFLTGIESQESGEAGGGGGGPQGENMTQ